MKKSVKKKIAVLVTSIGIIIVALILDRMNIISMEEYLGLESTNDATNNVSNEINNKELYNVVRVVDGDTFIIDYKGQEERVRLIGIDTPESVHPNKEKNTNFGNEVSNYTKKMLTGKQVALEFDVEKRDKYGRLLAYVYLDGQMYNKMLLEKGYAQVSTYPPNVKYVKNFINIQKQARARKMGIWKY